MNTDQTLLNRAVGWWNSLNDETRRNLIYKIWTEHNQPFPNPKPKKPSHSEYKNRLIIKGWGDGQKVLKVFPGGYLVFALYDSKGEKIGIEVTATPGTTRAKITEEIMEIYRKEHGVDIPFGYKLIYQEVFG